MVFLLLFYVCLFSLSYQSSEGTIQDWESTLFCEVIQWLKSVYLFASHPLWWFLHPQSQKRLSRAISTYSPLEDGKRKWKQIPNNFKGKTQKLHTILFCSHTDGKTTWTQEATGEVCKCSFSWAVMSPFNTQELMIQVTKRKKEWMSIKKFTLWYKEYF